MLDSISRGNASTARICTCSCLFRRMRLKDLDEAGPMAKKDDDPWNGHERPSADPARIHRDVVVQNVDPAESFTRAAASPCIVGHSSGQMFGVDATGASFVHTEEPARLQQDPYRKPLPGCAVPAMYPGRATAAAWTRRERSAGPKFDLDRSGLRPQANQLHLCSVRDQRSSMHPPCLHSSRPVHQK
jgi:hypothetical protein